MPVVSDIQKQKKRDTRYSIFIDGEYAFSLSDLELSNSSLTIGKPVTAGEVQELQKLSEEGKANGHALQYLSLRQRSRKELTTYLRRHGYAEGVIEPVINKLAGYHLVDDAAMAASWVSDRKALKPRSRRMIEQELREKGISGDDLEAALVAVSEDDELDMLRQIIGKKISLSRYQERNKLINYLVSQGFGYALVKRALAEFD